MYSFKAILLCFYDKIDVNLYKFFVITVNLHIGIYVNLW